MSASIGSLPPFSRSIDDEARALVGTLRQIRFRLDNEKLLQQQVGEALAQAGYPVKREVRLAHGDIIDFTVGAVGIEAKIKGSTGDIWRQIERYCGHASIEALILLTNKTMGLPPESCGKSVFYVPLGRSWL